MLAIFRRLYLTAMIAFMPAQASADFFANYASWRDAPELVREGYVMGIYDRSTKLWSGDAGEKAVAIGIQICAKKLDLNSSMMAEAVDQHYKTNTARWSEGPFFIFHDVITRGACLSFVNAERMRLGLDPWK